MIFVGGNGGQRISGQRHDRLLVASTSKALRQYRPLSLTLSKPQAAGYISDPAIVVVAVPVRLGMV